MGKGFQNFMSKKTFHPGSYQNQRRIQEAEAAAEAKRKHDEETLAQYLKEQELFQQQSLVSRESKDKLSLNFMYSAPPGTSNKKDEDKTDTCDEDIMLRTSIKWNKEIKQESQSAHSTKKSDYSDDDEGEPRIVLKWKRTEPKSKNRRTDTQSQHPGVEAKPLSTTIKVEKHEIKRVKTERR